MKNLVILLLLFSSIINAQTLKYEITANKMHIGNLSVTKTEENNTLQIEVVSEVKVKLFITVDLKYILNCTYKNNELIFSSTTAYVNGKVHTTSKTEKVGEYYTITKDGHSSKYLNKINFSGALLYFSPPKGVQHIYSEFDNVEKTVKFIGDNEYQITNPKNGYLNDYFYENNLLQVAKIHHTLLTFVLTKI